MFRPKSKSAADALWQRSIPLLSARLELGPVLREVAHHLDAVDAFVDQQAAAFDPGIAGYVRFLMETRGKGIRPAMGLLAGGMAGQVTDAHVRLGTVVELIHIASLVHDDILDRAETRRGHPSAQAKWGPEIAVLLGDSLFAHALNLCTEFETNEVARRIAAASSALCQGEILQTQRQFDLGLSVNEYRRIIAMKTGALFSVSCELGVLLAGGSPEQIEAARLFGERVGTAYQIYDDCLDLVGTEDSGKTLGTDLAKGKFTLPILMRLAEAADEAERSDLGAVLLRGDPEQRLALIEDLHAQGVLVRVIETLRAELRRSREALETFEPNRFRAALELMTRLLDDHVGAIAVAGC